MKIAIGPIQYFWPRNTVYEFYEAIADTAVDIVYLGEVVCSKRRNLKLQDWLGLAEQLTNNGKQVILSTLTLIEAESELKTLRKICLQGGYLIEANDVAAVQILRARRRPFITGPFINIYNEKTLELLIRQGLKRWVMPVELSATTLKNILGALNASGRASCVETEVYAYGRLPLAYSARCFTARSHAIPKDSCHYICGNYPEGMQIETQEKQALFTLNGIQTQSANVYNLLSEVSSMKEIGVDVVRLDPQIENMPVVIARFINAIQGNVMLPAESGNFCNGYWYGLEGIKVTQQ